jgi:hypothetical protein
VGGKSFKSKEKKNTGWGARRKYSCKKKLRSGLKKGIQKKSTCDGAGIKKENPISAPSIHVGDNRTEKPIFKRFQFQFQY